MVNEDQQVSIHERLNFRTHDQYIICFLPWEFTGYLSSSYSWQFLQLSSSFHRFPKIYDQFFTKLGNLFHDENTKSTWLESPVARFSLALHLNSNDMYVVKSSDSMLFSLPETRIKFYMTLCIWRNLLKVQYVSTEFGEKKNNLGREKLY